MATQMARKMGDEVEIHSDIRDVDTIDNSNTPNHTELLLAVAASELQINRTIRTGPPGGYGPRSIRASRDQ